MSAPLIWIILPGAAAVGLLGLRRWPRIQWVTGLVVTLLLALLAWRLPIGQLVILGPLNFKIEPTLAVLGRKFTILDAARPGLQAIYLIAAFWFGGAIMARPGRLFIPMGLAILALLTAAVAVTPLLYAALLIEVAVLVSIPLLAAAGQPLGQGVLRYLSFQTLGMPFILLTGGLLVGIETDPGNPELVRRVGLLLALGFSLLLAIFPFHTWIPRLTEEAHPYAAAFVLLILPEMVVLFGLGFLDHYNWLLTLPQLTFWFQLGGVLMMVVGGGWAAFQRHLGRLMGYAVIVGIGAALLALSQPDGLTLYFAGRLPRVVGLGVWALALALLREKAATLRFSDVQGLARQRPITAAALILAQFSLAGLPLLAGFPARLALLERVAEQQLWVALLALLGSVGLFIGALRSLAALVMGGEPGEAWRITESRWQSLFLLAGSAFLLLMGLFPQWSLTLLSGVPEVFEHLLP